MAITSTFPAGSLYVREMSMYELTCNDFLKKTSNKHTCICGYPYKITLVLKF